MGDREEKNKSELEQANEAGRLLVKFLRDRGIFAWPEDACWMLTNPVVRQWIDEIREEKMEGPIVAYYPVGKR